MALNRCYRNAQTFSRTCYRHLSTRLSWTHASEMCVVAFERFPVMREASLRLCARQLRRKDFEVGVEAI